MSDANNARVYATWCQRCVWLGHPILLTTYSLRAHPCDRCGRLSDCALVDATAEAVVVALRSEPGRQED